MSEIAVKRAYETARTSDHQRVLVDRLWPRGISHEDLDAHWIKDIAPSDELRHWFNHEPAKWDEFRKRYRAELDANPDPVAELRALIAKGPVTLVFAAKDETHNNAVALREYLS